MNREQVCVMVRGKSYPVSIEGKGTPCLAIGNGLLINRTLSPVFKEHFKVYASDLYWGKAQGLTNPTSLTFDHILEDIIELHERLELDEPILFGFSAFGLVALELVKRSPDLAKAVIMVGTPFNANAQVAQQNHERFQLTAEDFRQNLYFSRKESLLKEDLSCLSFQDRFRREYIFRDAPKYWHNPEYDCSHLWEGIELDQVIEHFFASLLPGVDVSKNIHTVSLPIYLAAGVSDFDCCPAQTWRAAQSVPPRLTLETYHHSGHYPQFEEPSLFDARVKRWAFHEGLLRGRNGAPGPVAQYR